MSRHPQPGFNAQQDADLGDMQTSASNRTVYLDEDTEIHGIFTSRALQNAYGTNISLSHDGFTNDHGYSTSASTPHLSSYLRSCPCNGFSFTSLSRYSESGRSSNIENVQSGENVISSYQQASMCMPTSSTIGVEVARPKYQRRAENGFPCRYHLCSRVFDAAWEQHKHEKSVHTPEQEKSFRCSEGACMKGFMSRRDLNRYQAKKHKSSDRQPSNKLFDGATIYAASIEIEVDTMQDSASASVYVSEAEGYSLIHMKPTEVRKWTLHGMIFEARLIRVYRKDGCQYMIFDTQSSSTREVGAGCLAPDDLAYIRNYIEQQRVNCFGRVHPCEYFSATQ